MERYSRQIALPEIGRKGQKKLGSSRVLLVGAGGLGSVAGFYLAAAGIGELGIIDDDTVEISNLQRQIAYTTRDVGRPKASSAATTFKALNPDVSVFPYPVRLSAANAASLVGRYDFVIDATDNFSSKFLIADACHAAGAPYSHAGIYRFQGQTMTVLPGRTACYRCVFEAPPKTTKRRAPIQGPLGAVPGVIGSIQAIEAIKYLLGAGKLLTNRLLTFDALTMNVRIVEVLRNARCPLCGKTAK